VQWEYSFEKKKWRWLSGGKLITDQETGVYSRDKGLFNDPSQYPGGRKSASFVFMKDLELGVLFGGFGSTDEASRETAGNSGEQNDLWTLSTKMTGIWNWRSGGLLYGSDFIDYWDDSKSGTLKEYSANTEITARHRHSAFPVSSEVMGVFGGWSFQGYLNGNVDV